MRGDRLWPDVMDKDASEVLEIKLGEKGIKIEHETDIKEIVIKDKAVQGVVTTNDVFVECQIVGAIDKLKPNMDFLSDSGVNVSDGILVNNNMRTNIDNIYAAGDVAQLANDTEEDIPKINIRWLKAWRQGQVAGENMTGKDSEYDDVSCVSSTQVCGVDLVSMLDITRLW